MKAISRAIILALIMLASIWLAPLVAPHWPKGWGDPVRGASVLTAIFVALLTEILTIRPQLSLHWRDQTGEPIFGPQFEVRSTDPITEIRVDYRVSCTGFFDRLILKYVEGRDYSIHLQHRAAESFSVGAGSRCQNVWDPSGQFQTLRLDSGDVGFSARSGTSTLEIRPTGRPNDGRTVQCFLDRPARPNDRGLVARLEQFERRLVRRLAPIKSEVVRLSARKVQN